MRNSFEALARRWSKVEFADGILPHEKVIFPTFLSAAHRSVRILEVGCGSGRMIRVLHEHGVTAEFIGVDITKTVSQAPCKASMGDARSLPYRDGTFDLVYSLGVIEHFAATADAITEQARVVSPGGTVLITTPHLSPETLYRYYAYLRGKEYRDGSFEVVRGRNLTIRSLTRACENAGLKIIEAGAAGPVLSRWSLVNRLCEKTLGSKRFGAYLYVVGEKVTS